jgi:hypothetical protein
MTNLMFPEKKKDKKNHRRGVGTQNQMWEINSQQKEHPHYHIPKTHTAPSVSSTLVVSSFIFSVCNLLRSGPLRLHDVCWQSAIQLPQHLFSYDLMN